MLRDQIKGENDSWAIRWHASLFLKDRFCLHPVKPIVRNIGLDNSGTHCGSFDWTQDVVNGISLKKIPIVESKIFFKQYYKYLIFHKIRKIVMKVKKIPLFLISKVN